MSGAVSIRLTPQQAERYKALLLQLARYDVDEAWTDEHRKRLGLTVRNERDLWQLYWKLCSPEPGDRP